MLNIHQTITRTREPNFSNFLWHTESLDSDVEYALNHFNISLGSFLDVGCGHGTQSNLLQKYGFDVTGIDKNQFVLSYAKRINTFVNYVHEDILSTTLDAKFDYILDRGCFHILDAPKKELYVEQIYKLTNKLVFLKVGNEQNLKFEQKFIPCLDSSSIVNQFSKKFKILLQRDGIFNKISESQYYMNFKKNKKYKWAGNLQKPESLHSTFFVMQPL